MVEYQCLIHGQFHRIESFGLICVRRGSALQQANLSTSTWSDQAKRRAIRMPSASALSPNISEAAT